LTHGSLLNPSKWLPRGPSQGSAKLMIQQAPGPHRCFHLRNCGGWIGEVLHCGTREHHIERAYFFRLQVIDESDAAGACMFISQPPRPVEPLDVDANDLGRTVFGHGDGLVPPPTTEVQNFFTHKTAAERWDCQRQEVEKSYRRWFL
jgi:hypothetical protein